MVSDAAAKGKQTVSKVHSDDSNLDSSAYLISQSVPSQVAETLGMGNVKLIGGQVIGKLCLRAASMNGTIFPKLVPHFAFRSWNEDSC